MPRITPEEKLNALRDKRQKIDAQIAKEQARVKTAERKADTRRKIVTGALALENAKYDPAFGKALYDMLEKQVTRDDDRALFGFGPLPEPSSSAPAYDGMTENERPQSVLSAAFKR